MRPPRPARRRGGRDRRQEQRSSRGRRIQAQWRLLRGRAVAPSIAPFAHGSYPSSGSALDTALGTNDIPLIGGGAPSIAPLSRDTCPIRGIARVPRDRSPIGGSGLLLPISDMTDTNRDGGTD